MIKITSLLLPLMALLLCQGCGTVAAYGHGYPTTECRAIRREYYPAVKMDKYILNKLNEEEESLGLKIVMTPILVVDVPISACVDTIALPFKFIDKKYSNQRFEPTANTPVDPVEEQGTDTAHP